MNYFDDWRRKSEFGKVQNRIHCASFNGTIRIIGAQKICRIAMTETF
jgi:hypothetical protein